MTTVYNMNVASVSDIATITAGTTFDNVDYTSSVIDTADADYLKLAIPYTVSLASGKTVSLTVTMEQSADNSSWDDAQTLLATSVVKSADGAAIVAGSDSVEFDLHAKDMKKYVKFKVKPDLSNSGTDTFSGKIVAMAVGGDNAPNSLAVNTVKA